MIRLVVSNPVLPPRPPAPTPKQLREAAEAEHLELPALELEYRISDRESASILIWPYRKRTWSMTFLAVCGEAKDVYVQRDFAGFPSRLAAFDHACASVRRSCIAQASKYPINAAAILTWVDSLEAPL